MYGSLELSADYLPVLDPVHNTVSRVPLTVRDPNTQPATGPPTRRAVRVLGRHRALDEQEQRPQSDDRREGTRVDHVEPFVRRTIPAFCKAGSTHPSAKLFPVNALRATARDVRSEDEEAHAHQHLLRHAPSDVRRGRESHAVDERRWRGRRLARHEDVRRDGRRGEVAGLDGAHPRRERQRQARRLHGAEPTGRPDKGSAHQRRTLLRGARARRLDLGIVARLPRRHRAHRSRRASARDRARRVLRAAIQQSESARCRASRRAAPTSTATAWRGSRSRAVTWRASTGASAKVRSTVPPPPASIAPKAGRSTPSRCRNSRA